MEQVKIIQNQIVPIAEWNFLSEKFYDVLRNFAAEIQTLKGQFYEREPKFSSEKRPKKKKGKLFQTDN